MTRCWFGGAAMLVAAMAVSSPASAQNAGFALDRYDPAERGSDWFAAESLDLRGHLRPAIGMTADYAYRPLVLRNADGSVRSSIVRDQLFFHLGGNLVLWDRLRVGLNIPIAAYQDGHDGVANGAQFLSPASTTTLGDLRLGADVRILGAYGDPFQFAAGLQIYFPTGQRDSFTGDETVRVQPRLLVAGDIGPFAYAARTSINVRSFDKTFAGSQLGSELLFGASAGLKLLDKKTLVVGPELYGSTVIDSDDGPFTKRNTPFELLFGAHYTFLDDWRAGAAVGPGISRGYGAPAFRLLGSVEYAPAFAKPVVDTDRDGINDGEDACPRIPGVRTADPATNGCPPVVPSDRDRDGIVDAQDACPDVPGVKTDDPKTNGCPPDRDKDTIVDADDACPDVPGVKTDDPKTNGCPPDRDKDTIVDADDACPDVPGVKTEDPKTNGCPSDRDKDGIADDKDACPDEPGPPNEDPKKNGCPAAFVKEGKIVIIEQVKFRINSAELDPAGDSILEAVLKVLNDHPEIKKVEVQGHTDNKGSAPYNLTLSNGRAASVLKWLVKKGVDKKRIASKGYGLTKPIDTNDTDEGRRNNRRVEFQIIELPVAPATKAPAAPAPSAAPKK